MNFKWNKDTELLQNRRTAPTFPLFIAAALIGFIGFLVIGYNLRNSESFESVTRKIAHQANALTSDPKEIILHEVPFTPQSPFAEWKDPRQQEACEEASVLMAMHWVRGEKIESKEKAREELLAINKYQEETYGESLDTSVRDTADRMIEGYYNYDNYEIKDVSKPEDIIRELEDDHLVIVPLNGRMIENKYFTQPGPERHMLVIVGYDKKTAEFITNEPGIRQGESWRYKAALLFEAIRDYETGHHVPTKGESKVMIVMKK